MFNGQMLVYQPEDKLTTNSENIVIGFHTREKGGVIMEIANGIQVF